MRPRETSPRTLSRFSEWNASAVISKPALSFSSMLRARLI